MNHRDRRILNLAHALHDCTMQIPGVCRGYSVEGLEPAHSNQARHGKGGAMKAHDIFHAAICHECHVEIDQGKRLSREERAEYWQRAHEATLLEYVKRGWLRATR